MGMSQDTKNLLFVILAVIGALVVGGWLLKIAFKLLGLVILIGLAVVAYILIQKMVGRGR
jgi:membrane protein implicated in regulation of membrane protease activity